MRKHFLFAVIWSAIAESLTVTRKNKRFFSVTCIALIVAAILSIKPANAKIATTLTLSGTHATITPVTNNSVLTLCAGIFNHEQRMSIGGVSMLFPTEFIYPTGHFIVTLLESCGGYNVYGLTSCLCLTDDFEITAIPMDAENDAPNEITIPDQIGLVTVPRTAGYLWIRKNK